MEIGPVTTTTTALEAKTPLPFGEAVEAAVATKLELVLPITALLLPLLALLLSLLPPLLLLLTLLALLLLLVLD